MVVKETIRHPNAGGAHWSGGREGGRGMNDMTTNQIAKQTRGLSVTIPGDTPVQHVPLLKLMSDNDGYCQMVLFSVPKSI